MIIFLAAFLKTFFGSSFQLPLLFAF